jgi:3-isopropylmalate dehydrogenase
MKIGILLGDDIGLEVVPECVKVIKAAAARTGLAIDWQSLPIGRRGHEEHGNTLPGVTEQALRDLDAGSWGRSATPPIRATTRPG